MILLCGIPSETPLAMVGSELERMGADFRILNQRHVANCALSWEVSRGEITGTLDLEGESFDVRSIDGAYVRLMDDRLLPELRGLGEDSPERRRSRAFHDALYRWLELAPGRVVNRSGPQGSNSSKPYQAQLIAASGFLVPETLITNDPACVTEFASERSAIIYKSTSGIRSIVQEFGETDRERLELIRWCPVQFQERIPGVDVRVHVVGEEAFPTRIVSDVLDYRYAKKQGGRAELEAVELAEHVVERCVLLAKKLMLPFVGIDLKVTPDDEVYCFEVNPCPAFSYFEANTGQPIARAVARYLVGAQ
jgi:glutathione synthase/RimK-type ligase-like ATP-grasp enzyme